MLMMIKPRIQFNFIVIPLTLTIISTSLPRKSQAAAKVFDRKRAQKKTQEALMPEQLKSWLKKLPDVLNHTAYTEILSLKNEGKLKHVIKPSNVGLGKVAEPILVVVVDYRVLRIVLLSLESDRKFWESWDALKIGPLCVNAYSPPVKRPELPAPYLGSLWRVAAFMSSWFEPKKESKKTAELRKARMEHEKLRKVDLERLRRRGM
ncbi:hypothetical protein SLEP1_g19886 [Rubroshorea leprosula]|uniref:Uncharacterized protein n=1 Tax=Rubroshorea leprosula TaxID=152421 RepID=A0AAV5J6U6_9ROSI|nr:hypothetical protein SLEP1_g19886 [Rubroshorea leprosula]